MAARFSLAPSALRGLNAQKVGRLYNCRTCELPKFHQVVITCNDVVRSTSYRVRRARNILIQSMSSPLAHDAWPPPLAHCGKPLVEPADDRVTIAELSDEPI